MIFRQNITGDCTHNETYAPQTSVQPPRRNLSKQTKAQGELMIRGVFLWEKILQGAFRILFAEITFNTLILSQTYESFDCITDAEQIRYIKFQ